MESNYSVYLHTTPSDKVYVGITNQRSNHRWGKNGNNYKKQVFGLAVRKYGWDNIRHEVLFEGLTLEEAEAKEKELIAKYHANDPQFGYNCTDGGGVCQFNDDAKKRISNSLAGRKLTEEHKKNIGIGAKGHQVSEETRRKISENRKGKYPSDETIALIKEAHQWQAKRVVKMTMDGEILEIYNSVGAAAEATGCSKYLIRRVCQGKRQSTNGFRWAFYEGGD